MPTGSRTSTREGNKNARTFEAFFEGWLVLQEHYLDELLSANRNCQGYRDDDLIDLINRVLAHYQQYYEEKSHIAQQDIFLVLSPTWFTSLEHTFFWLAGFKPGLAFRVINDSVNDLSAEQNERMHGLADETRIEERMLNDELAKIQESVAAPPLLEVAKQWGRRRDGEAVEEAAAAGTEALRSALKSAVASADLLRTSTVAKVSEILNPRQNLKFLTAATELHLKIRTRGLQIDAERRELSGLGSDI